MTSLQKRRLRPITLLAGVGIVVLHFVCVFSIPAYRQWIRDFGHSVGAIDARDLQEAQYLRELFDSIEGTKGKTIVDFGEDASLAVTIDVNVADRAAFKQSLEEVRKKMKTDFGSEPRPFYVKTRDYEFRLPE